MATNYCNILHEYFQKLDRHSYPLNKSSIPKNGIYVLFEREESGHEGERIVRVGTHDGDGRLLTRLKDHFDAKDQRSSIFRKHIGRCFLEKTGDDYIQNWDLRFKKQLDKIKNKDKVDLEYEKKYEKMITDYVQESFSFVIIPNLDKHSDRKHFESRIISTVSNCSDCKPSKDWLGQFHPNTKIIESGLWNVNHLYQTNLNKTDIEKLKGFIGL